MTVQNLSSAEQTFQAFLQTQGKVVEISGDKTAVIIDGQNRGSFDDTKAIFAQEWAEAQSIVQNTNAKLTGTLYNNVTCTAANVDVQSVANTAAMFTRLPSLTNVPIRFSNGEVLTIADDADMSSFLNQWVPFRLSVGTGFSVDQES